MSDGVIKYDAQHAERFVRKFCHFLWECWTPADIAAHWACNYATLAAIEADFPEYFEIALNEIEGYGMRPDEVHQCPSVTGVKPQENLMATNPNFLKIMLRDVIIKWPRLDQPYHFDPHKQETVPCAPNAQGAGYSIHWAMTKAEANAFGKQCMAHYNDCATREKLPPFARIFGSKPETDENGAETGLIQFRAKRNAMSRDGKVLAPPQVVGLDLQPLADPKIWTGSKCTLRLSVFPSTDPQTKEGGITVGFDAVQVIEAVYGGGNLEDDFGAPQSAVEDASDFAQQVDQKVEQTVQRAAQSPAMADDMF